MATSNPAAATLQTANVQTLLLLSCYRNCVQIVTDRPGIDELTQLSKLVRTFDAVRHQSIFGHNASECRDIVVRLSDDVHRLQQWFHGDVQRFHPFTHIFVLSTSDLELSANSVRYIADHFLQVYTIDAMRQTIRHIPTNKSLRLLGATRSELAEFANLGNRRLASAFPADQRIRASMHPCPPYIIADGPQLDGIEYRLMVELTKRWRLQLDAIEAQPDAWLLTIHEVHANRSDVALCGQWLEIETCRLFDCSAPLDFMCGTFLVPAPVRLNAATAVYLSLSGSLWLVTLISFGLTVSAVQLMAMWRRDRNASVGRTVLDVAALTVLQSVREISAQMLHKRIVYLS